MLRMQLRKWASGGGVGWGGEGEGDGRGRASTGASARGGGLRGVERRDGTRDERRGT